MYFIWYIIMGIAAGIIADRLTRSTSLGLFAYSLVGVVGGLLGGWASSFLGIAIGGSFFTALTGTVLLVWGLSFIKNPLSASRGSSLPPS